MGYAHTSSILISQAGGRLSTDHIDVSHLSTRRGDPTPKLAYPTSELAITDTKSVVKAETVSGDRPSDVNQAVVEDRGPLGVLYGKTVFLASYHLAFLKHSHPLCPNNFALTGISAVLIRANASLGREAELMWDELMRLSSGASPYDRLEQWINGFVYAVVFCNGMLLFSIR